MKSVQIPYELLVLLFRYHLLEDESCAKAIQLGLEKKVNALADREIYSKYKTAPTQEEREKARTEYLDKRGVSDSFRW